MTTQTTTTTEFATSGQPGTAAVFHKIKLLAGGYLGVSLAALAAIVLMRNHTAEVTSSVWVQGIVIAASAVGAFVAANRAAHGSRGAYLRLRILSVVVVAAVVVKIALPGVFPLWVKAELGVLGLLMAGVAVLVNSSQLRSLFAAR